MKKIKLLFSCLYFLFSLPAFSQLDSLEQSNIVNQIENTRIKWYRGEDLQKYKDTLDLYDPADFSVDVFRGKLIGYRALLLSQMHDSIAANDTTGDFDYDEVLLKKIDSLYKLAAATCHKCRFSYMLANYEYRKEYLENLIPELDTLKKYGYHPKRVAFWLKGDFFIGKNQWGGAEISFGEFDPAYRIKSKEKGKKIVHETSMQYSYNLFNTGFRKNLNGKGWGMNLSTTDFSIFFAHMRLANFTYLNNGSKGTFGYCPEIGIQFWYFFIHYGYNIAFKKSMRGFETHLLNFKLEIPIGRFND
ncbi:MAG: hypothetical protein IAF38_21830 [Bacteroidia bacterium]|nr:hypothetical protein [Bacteroidia bacterium]